MLYRLFCVSLLMVSQSLIFGSALTTPARGIDNPGDNNRRAEIAGMITSWAVISGSRDFAIIMNDYEQGRLVQQYMCYLILDPYQGILADLVSGATD